MKRIAVLLAVLVPVSLFTAGCGQGGGGNTEKAPVKSKAEQEAFIKQRIEEMKNVKGVQGTMKTPESPK